MSFQPYPNYNAESIPEWSEVVNELQNSLLQEAQDPITDLPTVKPFVAQFLQARKVNNYINILPDIKLN